MASGDAFDAAPGAAVGAVLGDGVEHVLAAGGQVSALVADEGAEGDAVEVDAGVDEGGKESVVEPSGPTAWGRVLGVGLRRWAYSVNHAAASRAW